MFNRAIKSSTKSGLFLQVTRQKGNKTDVSVNPSANQQLRVNGSNHQVNQTQKLTFGGGFLAGMVSTATLTAVGMYAIHSHCQKNPNSNPCETLKKWIFN